MSDNTHRILQAQNVSKSYREAGITAEVLKEVNLGIEPGERVAIIGASGSGKSTLLHLLGGLDLPSDGDIWVNGQNISRASDTVRGRIRNQSLGFIYQFHHLLPEFSALENVAMPLFIRKENKVDALAKAQNLLQEIGLGHRLEHRPVELSGGERQRTAIARALITRPACILADEPTGNLDVETAKNVFGMLMELNQKVNSAIVLVTHDIQLAKKMDTVYHLQGENLTKK